MPNRGKNLITLLAQDRAGNATKKEIVIEKVKTVKNKSMGTTDGKEKGVSYLSLSLGTLTIVIILGVLALFVK